MRDEGPGDAENARVLRERALREFRQLPVVACRQILSDLPYLGLDDVEIIEQPFCRRRDRPPAGDAFADRLISRYQSLGIFIEPLGDRFALCLAVAGKNLLRICQAFAHAAPAAPH